MKNKGNTTLAIKAAFSNATHQLLNPNPVKNSDRWKNVQKPLTAEQKIELFDKIVALDKESTQLLGSYWFKCREIKRRDKARHARGWKPKVKKVDTRNLQTI